MGFKRSSQFRQLDGELTNAWDPLQNQTFWQTLSLEQRIALVPARLLKPYPEVEFRSLLHMLTISDISWTTVPSDNLVALAGKRARFWLQLM